MQRALRESHARRVQQLHARREALNLKLALVKQALKKRDKGLYRKRDMLNESLSELEQEKTKQLKHIYPEILHVKQIQYGVLVEQLEKQQRRVLRDLSTILPLKQLAQSERSRQSEYYRASGACLSICGCVIPQDEELTSFPPDEVASALGYLLQFVNLAARYLGVPLLHSGAFAASTSAVWPFTTRKNIEKRELPLYMIPPRVQNSHDTLQQYLDSGIEAAVSAFSSPQGMHPSGWYVQTIIAIGMLLH